MSTIYKYEILPWSPITIPVGHRFLSVGMQDGKPYVWALVDLSRPVVGVQLVMVGTGHNVDEGRVGRFIGTIQGVEDWIVLHVFEAAVAS